MNVDVRFFASLKEVAGTDRMQVVLQDGAGFDDLLAALRGNLPAGAVDTLLRENVRLAVNQTLCAAPVALSDGDELAFLPPVTGG